MCLENICPFNVDTIPQTNKKSKHLFPDFTEKFACFFVIFIQQTMSTAEITYAHKTIFPAKQEHWFAKNLQGVFENTKI